MAGKDEFVFSGEEERDISGSESDDSNVTIIPGNNWADQVESEEDATTSAAVDSSTSESEVHVSKTSGDDFVHVSSTSGNFEEVDEETGAVKQIAGNIWIARRLNTPHNQPFPISNEAREIGRG